MSALDELIAVAAKSGGALTVTVDFGTHTPSEEGSGEDTDEWSEVGRFLSLLRRMFGVPEEADTPNKMLEYLEQRLIQVQGDRNILQVLEREVKETLATFEQPADTDEELITGLRAVRQSVSDARTVLREEKAAEK